MSGSLSPDWREDGLLVVQNGASEIIPHRVELVAVSSGGEIVPSCKGAAGSTPEIPPLIHTYTYIRKLSAYLSVP
jgi:hypothetical protein